jgi:hypothetical protein
MDLDIQKFVFDMKHGLVQNIITKNVGTITTDPVVGGFNVDMQKEKEPEHISQHWVVLECKNITPFIIGQ